MSIFPHLRVNTWINEILAVYEGTSTPSDGTFIPKNLSITMPNGMSHKLIDNGIVQKSDDIDTVLRQLNLLRARDLTIEPDLVNSVHIDIDENSLSFDLSRKD